MMFPLEYRESERFDEKTSIRIEADIKMECHKDGIYPHESAKESSICAVIE